MRVSANYRYGTDLQLKVTYGDEAELQAALKADNICVRFLCSYVVVSVVTSRIGKSFVTKGENYPISTQDPLQAYHFWWFMLNFFIAGVTKGELIDVPGLSLLTTAQRPVSECETMRLSARSQLAKLTLILKETTPDLFNVFFLSLDDDTVLSQPDTTETAAGDEGVELNEGGEEEGDETEYEENVDDASTSAAEFIQFVSGS